MDCYDIVCECLCALESWGDEEKSRLLDTIIRWKDQFENSSREEFEKNIRHLLELLTDEIVTVPLVPVEIILQTIESVDISAEDWRNALLALALSQTDRISSDSSSMTSPHPSQRNRYIHVFVFSSNQKNLLLCLI